MKKFLFSAIAAVSLVWSAEASVSNFKASGWLESAYATWSPVAEATGYNVYIKASTASTWTQLDAQLVRQYPDYYRVDALGLKAGDYMLKVVPVNANGEMTAETTESATITAMAHDRSGFAHVGMTGGIGAYKNDGTLKDGARVIYVWAGNAKTVTCDVITNSKGAKTTGHGLQDIISLYQKGYDTTPLSIRIIGKIKGTDMDRFDSSAEGLQVKGKAAYSEMPITIEGVGSDATIHGFGILVRNCKGTEFRNFAIMLCMDDCLSIDTENSHLWVHNMDFFYGNTGGDADQAKGDGTVDLKGHSMNCTVSYNHFFDAGKCSLGGMSGEETDAWHTYHHNWFDHSDSRHPRIRVQFFHIYNNYYDGNAKYGVGVTSGGSAFVENNYFRNCQHPMLTAMQGSDIEGSNPKGTFSGEDGGIIKAYNNTIIGGKTTKFNLGSQTDYNWDAVLVSSRDAEVTATCKKGGTGYNAEADHAARTTYIENKIEDPSTVVATVTGPLGAGRMNHGDFSWTFNNATEDTNYGVITALKTALINYKSQLVAVAGESATTEPETPDQPVNPEQPDPDQPENPDQPGQVIEGEVVCHFSDKKPSSSMVTVSGNYSNSKGNVTYGGTTYDICVKMESATEISIRPTGDCSVALIFGPTEVSKKLKIDGVSFTTDAKGQYTFSAKGNTTYKLTKGDSINLFLILFTPNASGISNATVDLSAKPIFDLQGRLSTGNCQGLYIINGQKVIVK